MVRCVICDQTPFCTWCAIRDDDQLLICCACDEEQTMLAGEREEETRQKTPCSACGNVIRLLEQCRACNEMYCRDICTVDPKLHACVQCAGCKELSLGWNYCCRKRWCHECRILHEKHNCEDKLSYDCSRCYKKVMMFGDSKFKCVVPGCPLQLGYPCYVCDVLKDGSGLLCCQMHLSPRPCTGCHAPYALDGKQGSVRLLYHGGPRQTYCSACYRKKILPFICCVWRMATKRALPIPLQYVENIIWERLRILFLTGE